MSGLRKKKGTRSHPAKQLMPSRRLTRTLAVNLILPDGPDDLRNLPLRQATDGVENSFEKKWSILASHIPLDVPRFILQKIIVYAKSDALDIIKSVFGPSHGVHRNALRIIIDGDLKSTLITNEQLSSFGLPCLFALDGNSSSVRWCKSTTPTGGLVRGPVVELGKLTEDILLDMCIGNSEPFHTIISSTSLADLFRKKVQYAHAHLAAQSCPMALEPEANYLAFGTWVRMEHRGSGKEDELDDEKFVRKVVEVWRDFIEWLTNEPCILDGPSGALLRYKEQIRNDGEKISPNVARRWNGASSQISTKKLGSRIDCLPPGTYYICRIDKIPPAQRHKNLSKNFGRSRLVSQNHVQIVGANVFAKIRAEVVDGYVSFTKINLS